jgi:hypothetical protein
MVLIDLYLWLQKLDVNRIPAHSTTAKYCHTYEGRKITFTFYDVDEIPSKGFVVDLLGAMNGSKAHTHIILRSERVDMTMRQNPFGKTCVMPTYICSINQDQSREQGRYLPGQLCILREIHLSLPVLRVLLRTPEWYNRHIHQTNQNGQSLYQSQMTSQLKPC